MPLHRTSPEKLQQAQNRLAAILEGRPDSQVPPDVAAGGAPGQTQTSQSLANVEAIRQLLKLSTFTYGGRTWEVRTLPFELGCQLLEQDIRVRKIAPHVANDMLLTEYRDAARIIADLIWQAVTPAGRWARIRKRLGLMRNPFLEASDADLGGIKDFCLTRRMASTVVLGGSGGSVNPSPPRDND